MQKYYLIKNRIYVNKTLSKILNEENGKYINVYYFSNKYGYIPTINSHHSFLLRSYLFYRVKKWLIPFPENKAIFFEKKIDIPLHSFSTLVDIFTNIKLFDFKECIFVPFNKEKREMFKKIDIFSWDVFVGICNLYLAGKTEIKIADFYRFLKGKSTKPTSINQLNPLRRRLKILSEDVKTKIDNKNIQLLDKSNITSKFSSYFLIPYEFFTVDPKFKIQKKIAYYLLFITQVKYIRKDKKTIKIGSILTGTGLNTEEIYKKRGFFYIEEKFWNAYELIEKFTEIKINTKYSCIETFIDAPLMLKPTKEYIKFIHKCINGENSSYNPSKI
ncbi:hypothetical protein [Persephonella hydrogeniphila]|uniref:hypothetical protein n=1 Tax=Persephonella hydrogeniphila TaxID=198703 RepID=UPI0015DF1D8E|nr:hypothetical protein [Persephonella hydrogeniphila]